MSYAGDLTPREAWEKLENNPDAVLVDCRTQAEWSFVGVPDLEVLHLLAVLEVRAAPAEVGAGEERRQAGVEHRKVPVRAAAFRRL